MVRNRDEFCAEIAQRPGSSHRGILPTPNERTTSPHSTCKPWIYDQTFGIIHQEHCRICRNYIVHISEAALDKAECESYHFALGQRDGELRQRFGEGFRRGRSMQQQHDNERLRGYRSQRDEARAREAIYKRKAEEADEVILFLRDELLALQVAYGELRTRFLDDFDEPQREPAADGASLSDPYTDSESESGLSDSSGSLDHDDGSDASAITNDTSPATGCEGGQIVSEDHGGVEDQLTHADFSGPPVVDETDRLAAMGVAEPMVLRLNAISVAQQNVSEEIEDDTHRTHPSVSHPSPERRITPSVISSPGIATTFSGSNSIAAIRARMELARQPNNKDIRARLEKLVAKAQITPVSQRTEVQRILLDEWVPPNQPSPPQHSNPEHLPSIEPTSDSSPVYVDASGSGIGFVFGNQWQAWKLQKKWRNWGSSSRDIQWAEAAAVELGLRLMIKAGHAGRDIFLQSDNLQVVEAIQGKSRIGEINARVVLSQIDLLCAQHSIRLKISWVRGKENPADAPSRLSSGSPCTGPRFPHNIDIPQHLQKLVFPYEC